MICAISRKSPIPLAPLVVSLLVSTGAPATAHCGPAPTRPTGLTAMRFHGDIALAHEMASPHVRLSWDEPGGADFLGFQHAEVIDVWIPLFLFSILFGLSMDYHVFLLSRIRERYDQTGDNAEAVAYGLRSTAGLITGAALIMVAVFGAFASGKTIINQQVGFGLSVAVLLDATLVRSVLVPASMDMLGKRNWYLPSWLNWLPDLRIQAEEMPAPDYSRSSLTRRGYRQ